MRPRSQRLRLSDVRSANRALGPLHDSAVPLATRITHLLDETTRLVGGDAALYCTIRDYLPGCQPRPDQPLFGKHQFPEMIAYFADRQRAASMEGDTLVDLTIARPEARVTVSSRSQMKPDEYARRYPDGSRIFSSGIHGDMAVTLFRHRNGIDISGIALHRLEGGPMSLREMRLVQYIGKEMHYLYQARGLVFPNAENRLPPRQQQIVDRVLTGRSPKEIAAELGLSRDTVSEYPQIIYRKFGVSSRDELILRLLRGQREHSFAPVGRN